MKVDIVYHYCSVSMPLLYPVSEFIASKHHVYVHVCRRSEGGRGW